MTPRCVGLQAAEQVRLLALVLVGRDGATPGSAAQRALSSDDLTRTLANLADLRDRGAITADEYERKKADLLGRL